MEVQRTAKGRHSTRYLVSKRVPLPRLLFLTAVDALARPRRRWELVFFPVVTAEDAAVGGTPGGGTNVFASVRTHAQRVNGVT